ncbi:MAG: MFS transporter [Spirochaetaceae bacterium]|nr:MFS transporter [Spirochaetaceae bacterium]
MNKGNFRLYGRRWAVLAVTMLVNATIQALWIAYAPVASLAAAYYGVSELAVGFFAMSFMLAFIPFSIPASWLIDRFGFARVVGIGSLAVGGFGLLRGLAGPSYALALAATAGMAVCQPLLLNAWTKMPAAWFPARERATAVGLTTLANIVGTAAGLVLTPILAESLGLSGTQLAYGAAALASGLAFVLVARERPATPPDESASGERALMLEGLRHALRVPSFRRYLLMAFIGMGVFNGVTTWVEAIARPRGVDPSRAGLLGAIMLAGGLVGAVLVPALSDRSGKRRPFIALGLAGAVPGLLGLAFAPSYPLLALSSLFLGFCLVAVSPVGMQYASESVRPTPEGSSNGLVSLAGQASVLLVYAMEALNRATGSFAASLASCAALLALAALLATRLKEAPSRP